ncbi:ParM/StbA family protein [Dictyobacter formicarum]|uniref:Actin-like protein N-terminal domain-containing protein n=1 Tax=Dictyobacter formicarum TaxID=2778368 RepID=A0ABQ3VPP5_9CHLR|nr:ParM/StbA family protein [Dictyobacter formicarum]GHO88229.1 hypothetical protein KSZ_62350 [Dictyobacter formicarum]
MNQVETSSFPTTLQGKEMEATSMSEATANGERDTMTDTDTTIDVTGATEKEYVVLEPQTYAYGHDFGNSEIGGVLRKGETVVTRSVPTAFTKINTKIMRNMGVDMSEALVVQMKGEQVSYGIGSIALSQSTDPWNGRGDITRYASTYSLRSLLAMSASMIPDAEYRLMVVTGLPAETYQKNPGLRKEIKAALNGKHVFSIDGGRSWRTCQVEVGAIVMEGAGALIAYGSKDQGARASAIIDIGGRTTDLYVARGQVPVSDFCQGKPVGVETATKMVRDAFEDIHGVELTPLEARELMHAYADAQRVRAEAAAAAAGTPVKTTKRKKTEPRTYPEITVSGQRIPDAELDRLVTEAIDFTAGEIVSFVSSAWRQSDATNAIAARFNPVLGIGGGVYYFYDALKKRIPHLSQPNEPVFANGRGYALSAQALLDRKKRAAAKV